MFGLVNSEVSSFGGEAKSPIWHLSDRLLQYAPEFACFCPCFLQPGVAALRVGRHSVEILLWRVAFLDGEGNAESCGGGGGGGVEGGGRAGGLGVGGGGVTPLFSQCSEMQIWAGFLEDISPPFSEVFKGHDRKITVFEGALFGTDSALVCEMPHAIEGAI